MGSCCANLHPPATTGTEDERVELKLNSKQHENIETVKERLTIVGNKI